MEKFKLGDVVRLKHATEEDMLHGRQVGEIAIFQEYEKYVRDDNTLCYVRFDNPLWTSYCVYESSLELVEPANIETIFKAFCMESEVELMNCLKEHFSAN